MLLKQVLNNKHEAMTLIIFGSAQRAGFTVLADQRDRGF
jgi:hypothetical protein